MAGSVRARFTRLPSRFRARAPRFISHVDEITLDISNEARRRLRKAAGYGARVMRKNAGNAPPSVPGGFPAKREGHLARSFGYTYDPQEQRMYMGSRSGKIHLTEFGHGDGKTRNRRPVITPSLREAAPGIKEILSERYW